MKAKEYAVSKGLARPGKGRMSREAHEAIRKAIDEGMSFSDYQVTKTDKSAGAEESTPLDVVFNPYAEAFYRYSQDQKFVYRDDNGKTHEISGKPACMGCGYSLVGHTCNSPVVLTYHGIRAVTPKGE